MLSRLCCATALGLLLSSSAVAQTVRFDTNVGNFDMVLNPTGNFNLQGHVDNLLAYVESGRYRNVVINRAAEDFVMQMAGFVTESLTLPAAFSDFPAVEAFDPIIVDSDGDGLVDFDVSSLLNTRGTVSLALSTLNSGTSSFFVNLGENTSLDADSLRFVPFAEIPDMATIDLIMGLDQTSLPGGGLGSSDIPILNDDRLVFVEQVYVLDPSPAAVPAAAPPVPLVAPSSAASFAAASVPEPATLALAAIGLLGLAARRQTRALSQIIVGDC